MRVTMRDGEKKRMEVFMIYCYKKQSKTRFVLGLLYLICLNLKNDSEVMAI